MSYSTTSVSPVLTPQSAEITPAAVIDAAQSGPLVVPGGNFLLTAEFHRVGGDLVLEGKDGGHQVVLSHYFDHHNPPDLHTAFGAVISGDLAGKLAGPMAPGQYAQADNTAPQHDPIGVVQKIEGGVSVRHADGTTETLVKGAAVYQGDLLETAKGGAVGVAFVDRSTFSLGGGGRMVMDQMVYDPQTHSGKSAFSVVQGTFSFVSGQIAKTAPDAMTVHTPVMTIGIRGTTVAGHASAQGEENTVTLLQDADGGTGQIVVTNDAGSVVLNSTNATVQLFSSTEAPPTPFTLSPDQVDRLYHTPNSMRPDPQDLPPHLDPSSPLHSMPTLAPSVPGGTAPPEGHPDTPPTTSAPGAPPPAPDPVPTTAPPPPEPSLPPVTAPPVTSPPVTAPPPITDHPAVTPPPTHAPDQTPAPTHASTTPGKVVDGYVEHSTVFRDINGDGVQDNGETSTQTDTGGNFTLAGSGGTIIATGGTDSVTGATLQIPLMAAGGATAITPLTTLVVVCGGNESLVKSLLGLTGITGSLNNYDPEAAALSGDATGIKAMMVGEEMVSTLTALEHSLAAEGLTFTPAQLLTALGTTMTHLGANGTLDFTNASTLYSVLDTLGTQTGHPIAENIEQTLSQELAANNAAYVLAVQNFGLTGASTLAQLNANTATGTGTVDLSDAGQVALHLDSLVTGGTHSFFLTHGVGYVTAAQAAEVSFGETAGAHMLVVDTAAAISGDIASFLGVQGLLVTGTGADLAIGSIAGAEGISLIDAAAAAGDVTLDVSSANNGNQFTLYGGSGNNTLIGHSGADTLIGHDNANNVLDGNGGSDQIYGGGGTAHNTFVLSDNYHNETLHLAGTTDVLDARLAPEDGFAGAQWVGSDLVMYFNADIGGGSVTLADYADGTGPTVSIETGNGSETVILVKGTTATGTDDLIIGHGNDTLSGVNEGDRFEWGGMNETILGGTGTLGGPNAGQNQVDFQFAQNGISANFANTISDGHGHEVVVVTAKGGGTAALLANIGEIDGTNYGDTITGGSSQLNMRAGSGDNVFTGGSGFFMLDYRNSTTGVEINLTTASINMAGTLVGAGTAVHDGGSVDILSGIGGIRGSNHNDVIAADNGYFNASLGDDSYIGSGTIDYSDSGTGITANLGSTTEGDLAAGQVSHDSLYTDSVDANISIISGSAFSDTIWGGVATTLDYQQLGTGITVDTGAGTVVKGVGTTDVIHNVHNFMGTAQNDVFKLDGVAGGSINGNGGLDHADYSASSTGINFSLVYETAVSNGTTVHQMVDQGVSGGQTDNLNGVAWLTGSQGGDVFAVDTDVLAHATLNGGGGVDTLTLHATETFADSLFANVHGISDLALDGTETVILSTDAFADAGFATVTGSSGDVVSLTGNGWVEGADSGGYITYSNGTHSLTVTDSVHVDLPTSLVASSGVYSLPFATAGTVDLAHDVAYGNGGTEYSLVSGAGSITSSTGGVLYEGSVGSFTGWTLHGNSNDTLELSGSAGASDSFFGYIHGIDVLKLDAGISVQLGADAVANQDVHLIDASTATGAVTVELTALGTDAATVLGGASNDLFLLDGNDTGAITLDGHGGVNTVSYANATTALDLDPTGGGHGSNNVTYLNIEHVVGSALGDTFIGGTASGSPTLDGGGGANWVDYSYAASAATVNLGGTNGGAAAYDHLVNIENIHGSNWGDALTGDAANNTIIGGSGADTINGGGGVNVLNGGAGDDILIASGSTDFMDGGSGSNTAEFASPVTVYLGDVDQNGTSHTGYTGYTGMANMGGSTHEYLVNIENLSVSSGNNLLVGDNNANIIHAGSGNDTLFGLGGDDTLYAGTGHSTLEGGTGNNLYELGSGNASVIGGGSDHADYSGATSGLSIEWIAGTIAVSHGGTDHLNGINAVTGSSFDDTFTVDSAAAGETLIGGGGHDTVALYGVDANLADSAFAHMQGMTYLEMDAGSAQTVSLGTDAFTDAGFSTLVGGSSDVLILGGSGWAAGTDDGTYTTYNDGTHSLAVHDGVQVEGLTIPLTAGEGGYDLSALPSGTVDLHNSVFIDGDRDYHSLASGQQAITSGSAGDLYQGTDSDFSNWTINGNNLDTIELTGNNGDQVGDGFFNDIEGIGTLKLDVGMTVQLGESASNTDIAVIDASHASGAVTVDLSGYANAVTVSGSGSNDDYLLGGSGPVSIVGGGGQYHADYSQYESGVAFDLENGTITANHGGTLDHLGGVDWVTGGSNSNDFIVDAGALAHDTLVGSGSNDTLELRGSSEFTDTAFDNVQGMSYLKMETDCTQTVDIGAAGLGENFWEIIGGSSDVLSLGGGGVWSLSSDIEGTATYTDGTHYVNVSDHVQVEGLPPPPSLSADGDTFHLQSSITMVDLHNNVAYDTSEAPYTFPSIPEQQGAFDSTDATGVLYQGTGSDICSWLLNGTSADTIELTADSGDFDVGSFGRIENISHLVIDAGISVQLGQLAVMNGDVGGVVDASSATGPVVIDMTSADDGSTSFGETLIGSQYDDTFLLNGDLHYTVTVYGGGGDNDVDYSASQNGIAFDLTGDAITAAHGSGTDVLQADQITGSHGADSFTVNLSVLQNVTLTGGGGEDTLVLTGADTYADSLFANVHGIDVLAMDQTGDETATLGADAFSVAGFDTVTGHAGDAISLSGGGWDFVSDSAGYTTFTDGTHTLAVEDAVNVTNYTETVVAQNGSYSYSNSPFGQWGAMDATFDMAAHTASGNGNEYILASGPGDLSNNSSYHDVYKGAVGDFAGWTLDGDWNDTVELTGGSSIDPTFFSNLHYENIKIDCAMTVTTGETALDNMDVSFNASTASGAVTFDLTGMTTYYANLSLIGGASDDYIKMDSGEAGYLTGAGQNGTIDGGGGNNTLDLINEYGPGTWDDSDFSKIINMENVTFEGQVPTLIVGNIAQAHGVQQVTVDEQGATQIPFTVAGQANNVAVELNYTDTGNSIGNGGLVNMTGIDEIQLGVGGNNTLTLNETDILNLTKSTGNAAISPSLAGSQGLTAMTNNALIIGGDASDTVNLTGWTHDAAHTLTLNGESYSVYTNNASGHPVTAFVDTHVHTTT